MGFPAPRKSRINTPQLLAQLSRLVDRTRLRHLKDTLRSKGAWQQVTRIEDLCHTHVSHKWLYHWEVSSRRMTTSPMYRQDLVTNPGQDQENAACVALSSTHTWSSQKHVAHRKQQGVTVLAFRLWFAV